MTQLAHEFTQTLPAPPEAAFAALTSEAALQVWFAAHVAIEARPGGRFQFWGKHTYGAPSHPGIETSLTLFEPGVAVGFDWPLENCQGRVEWRIAPKDEGSTLTVTHTLTPAPKIGRAKELIDDLWRLHLGALCTHLQGKPVDLPDFADPHPRVKLSIYIDAPRSIVWRAMTKPNLLNQWLTKTATIDLEAGTLDFGWSYEVGGEIVTVPPMQLHEVVENEKLVMQWKDWRGDADVPDQRVAWLLADEGQGTRVSLVHDGFTRTTDISDYPFGWVWFLEQLRAVGETEAGTA